MATTTKPRKPATAAKRKTTITAKTKAPAKPKRAATRPKAAAAKKTPAAKPKASRKVSSKRELINTGSDKRYVRRRNDGSFKESDDVSRSLSADRRRKAATKAKRGQGDRGD